MKNKIKEDILAWLKKKNINILDKTDLFSNTKIDSFAFIELLVFIENKFKIKLNHMKIFSKKKLTIEDLSKLAIKNENRKIKKKKL
tara:strand:- start:251 stop:508 length:258 start_codon:yes stop_codon:yes gene_type:complete